MNIFERAFDGDVQSILILFVCWMAFFVVKYHVELLKIASWPSVEGKLDDFRFLQTDGSIDNIMTIRYRFELNGREYKGCRLAHISFGQNIGLASLKENLMSKVQMLPGDKVVIHYHPTKPKKNLLVKPGRTEYVFLGLLYLTCIFGAYLAYIN